MVSNMRFLFLLAALIATPASAYTSKVNVAFGPYVGAGATSGQAKVRHTSGYSLVLDRNYQVTPNWAIGPRFEATNGFINTRISRSDVVQQGTYDNRIWAAGVRLSRSMGTSATFAQGLYLAGVAGRSYSKLQLDVTSDTLYEQNQYAGISGNYYAGEIGTWIPLRGTFGINFAILSSLIEADLGQASGTYEGDELVDGQLRLTQGTRSADEAGLGDRVSLRTHAARIAVSLGF